MLPATSLANAQSANDHLNHRTVRSIPLTVGLGFDRAVNTLNYEFMICWWSKKYTNHFEADECDFSPCLFISFCINIP